MITINHGIAGVKHNIPARTGATSVFHEPDEFPRALGVDRVSVVVEEVRIAVRGACRDFHIE